MKPQTRAVYYGIELEEDPGGFLQPKVPIHVAVHELEESFPRLRRVDWLNHADEDNTGCRCELLNKCRTCYMRAYNRRIGTEARRNRIHEPKALKCECGDVKNCGTCNSRMRARRRRVLLREEKEVRQWA